MQSGIFYHTDGSHPCRQHMWIHPPGIPRSQHYGKGSAFFARGARPSDRVGILRLLQWYLRPMFVVWKRRNVPQHHVLVSEVRQPLPLLRDHGSSGTRACYRNLKQDGTRNSSVAELKDFQACAGHTPDAGRVFRGARKNLPRLYCDSSCCAPSFPLVERNPGLGAGVTPTLMSLGAI